MSLPSSNDAMFRAAPRVNNQSLGVALAPTLDAQTVAAPLQARGASQTASSAVQAPTTPPASTGPTQASDGLGGDTSAFLQSIMGEINQAVKPNVLNNYYQPTYHFRLFTIGDTDLITALGATSITDLNRRLATLSQITIAESGVTGYNIRDVQIKTMPSGNNMTRTDMATTGVMTVTEPNGISFLDGLYAAGATLGTHNFTKCPYYLELRFLGYNEDGSIANSIDPFGTGGRWMWGIIFTNVDVAIDERGSVYTINFQLDNYWYHDVNSEVTACPQAIQVSGNTLGEVFQDYIDSLNQAWKNLYKSPIVQFDGIVTRPIDQHFSNPPTVAGKDPKNFSMLPRDPDHNTKRTLNNAKKYTVSVPVGYHLQEFIADCIKHTEEGQALTLDSKDSTATQINDRNVRETVAFAIEPAVKVTEFDPNTQNYVRHLTFYVTPYYTQKGMQHNNQQVLSASQQAQQRKVDSFIENGFLRKKYDYIFTGNNTEVIEFDLSFTTNFDAVKSAYNGGQMRYDVVTTMQRQTTTGPDTGNAAEASDTLKSSVATIPAPSGGGATTSGSGPVNATGQVAIGKASTANPQASSANTIGTIPNLVSEKVTSANPLPLTQNRYIEDLLNANWSPTGSSYQVPVAFQQSPRRSDNNSGQKGFAGQTSPNQSIVGAIWAQIYDQSITGSYSTLKKMTIRGDPYWLGQTNIHRQLNLVSGTVNVPGNSLPDYNTGQQVILINFRYPLQIGDDFKPRLRTAAIFSGLYYVNSITHVFSEGQFKQELEGVIDPLSNISKWIGANDTNNGGPASSSQQTQPPTSSTVGFTPPPT